MEADGEVETGDFVHVALTVSDVDETLTALDDERITGEAKTLADEGLRIAFIEDPDGWGIELIEHL